MTQYITSQGDTADYIAWKFYGNQNPGTVETLIDANKGLSDYGPELPGGLIITLPEIVVPATTPGVRLWD